MSGLFGKAADPNRQLADRESSRPLQTPRDVTEYILTQAFVVTVGGEGFGDQEHIRLSFAVSDEDIITAVDRIAAAVAHLN